MYALLGNRKGKVKPWYLPFDFVFCTILVNGSKKVCIARNSSVKNIYAFPVNLVNGVVIGPSPLPSDHHHTADDLHLVEEGRYICQLCRREFNREEVKEILIMEYGNKLDELAAWHRKRMEDFSLYAKTKDMK